MPCRPDITMDMVEVDVPAAAQQGVVVIVPVGDARAAVAYQVVKD
jgi:hypothetical protein